MRRAAPLLVAIAAVAAVVVPYLALGGASFEPAPVADPCLKREWRDPGDLEAVLEQIVLSALDGAACELGVTREELVLAVRDESSLEAFAEEHGLSRADAEQLVEDGLERAIDDAEERTRCRASSRRSCRRAAESLPPWLLLEAVEQFGGLLSSLEHEWGASRAPQRRPLPGPFAGCDRRAPRRPCGWPPPAVSRSDPASLGRRASGR